MPKTFFITTPIYYPSAKPHIGHLYTDICCDVFARWYRLKGYKVHFSTGTDEHGLKIQRVALSNGQTPKQYVDSTVLYFKELCKLYSISYDDFIRTTEDRHKKAVYALFKKLKSKKDIYKGTYEGLYCVDCETYYLDKDLVYGCCPFHGKPPQPMREDSYFFRMSKYQERLVEYIRHSETFILPNPKKKEILNRLNDPLKDLSITRTTFDWGIPYPDDKKHVFYVWLDALTNYLTTIGYPSPKYKKFWPADMHVIANDISWHHTVIWGSMLMSAGIKLPKTVFIHGFIKADNNIKMSKSLGNVVDPFELIKHYPADSVRYFLIRDVPFGFDGSFSHEALIQRHNQELANDLGNLLNRTTAMLNSYFDGKIPSKTKDEVSKQLDLKKIDAFMEKREMHNALNEIWKFINFINKYVNDKKPWSLAKNKKELSVVLYNTAESLRIIAILLKPFLPETSKEIALQLGINDFDKQGLKHVKFGLLKGKVGKQNILFKKIELTLKQEEGKMESTFIEFNDWKKIDIRVGTIKKAEPHPNADKLMVLQVDIGEAKQRQVVAGIKNYYKPEELVGKRVVIFANLKPVNLRGSESNGMILAAVNNKDVVLLTTDKTINNGAKVE
jgi:methionyl-tRNA synthetase